MDTVLPQREARYRDVASKRQANLTVILEDVHDPHNISAVLRSCDSVGVNEIFVVYRDPRLYRDYLELNKTIASGANKWIDVHFYTDLVLCMKHVQKKYTHIYTTHLAEDSVELYELDLKDSVALFFGNEKDGLTEEALAYTNGNFIIPQMGMVQSLNISVACAVSLYEAYRQRAKANMYLDNPTQTAEQQDALAQSYYQRSFNREKREKIPRIVE